MTVVVDVLIAVGVVVGILAGALILVTVLSLAVMALAKIPGVARLGRLARDCLEALVLFAIVGLALLVGLVPLLVSLMFVGVGIFLIVAGSGIGGITGSGQVQWGTILGGVIVCLLGLFFCRWAYIAWTSDSEDTLDSED
jgi:hypothetical protein